MGLRSYWTTLTGADSRYLMISVGLQAYLYLVARTAKGYLLQFNLSEGTYQNHYSAESDTRSNKPPT